jgi:hypothetical protein
MELKISRKKTLEFKNLSTNLQLSIWIFILCDFLLRRQVALEKDTAAERKLQYPS